MFKLNTLFAPMFVIMLILFGCTPKNNNVNYKAIYGNGDQALVLATGSPGELGLLKVLADEFNKDHDTKLLWKKAGSGKSLKLLKAKKVNVVMVHAPAAEKKAVSDGWAQKRTLIGSNEFYIVGPKNDPAGIKEATSAHEAYAKIAETKQRFLSRGDNSGTHKKELFIWKKAGIKPSGDWYITTKKFMMATLKQANAVGGYFMTDSSTWVAGKKEMENLTVLFRGDRVLVNTYHALCRTDGNTDLLALAEKFVDFLGSEKGQRIITEYGKDLYGESLYSNAAYAEQYTH